MCASKLNVTDNACTGREAVLVKEASTIEERDALAPGERKDACRARPHPAKLSTCAREPQTLELHQT